MIGLQKNPVPVHGSERVSRLDQWAKRRMIRRVEKLTTGQISLVDAEQVIQFGQPNWLRTTFRVHRSRFYRRALLGSVAIADSYIEGDWDCDDLTALFRMFVRNREALELKHRYLGSMADLAKRLFHWLRINTPGGSRRNIAAHYDLGNDFYRLWLDDTMAYSSGLFLDDADTMLHASREKFDRVCRKLDLHPGDQLLEIGTGFGGMCLHAAENYGCQVTTTTISEQQYREAEDRIRDSSAADRINLMCQDYRSLKGRYDKLVAIEMIEAVGHRFLATFFGKCSDLLKDDGTLILQAIVMPEHAHDRYLKSVDFLQRYVFPGGCLPSLASLLNAAGQTNDLRFVHAEDMAPHYAETLRRWRTAFQSNLEAVRKLGYSEKFIRLWNYYLCYCEAAFEERYIGVVQVQFDKPRCQRDPIQIGHSAAAARALSDGAEKYQRRQCQRDD